MPPLSKNIIMESKQLTSEQLMSEQLTSERSKSGPFTCSLEELVNRTSHRKTRCKKDVTKSKTISLVQTGMNDRPVHFGGLELILKSRELNTVAGRTTRPALTPDIIDLILISGGYVRAYQLNSSTIGFLTYLPPLNEAAVAEANAANLAQQNQVPKPNHALDFNLDHDFDPNHYSRDDYDNPNDCYDSFDEFDEFDESSEDRKIKHYGLQHILHSETCECARCTEVDAFGQCDDDDDEY